MQTGHAITEGRFGGTYHADGCSLFQGNSFHTNGGPIHFDLSHDGKPPAKICELPNFLLAPYFAGRGDKLQQIDRVFSTPSDDMPRCCIVNGMLVVGKNQVALKSATLALQKG